MLELDRAIAIYQDTITACGDTDDELRAAVKIVASDTPTASGPSGARRRTGRERPKRSNMHWTSTSGAAMTRPGSARPTTSASPLLRRPDGDRGANLARAKQLFERTIEITARLGESSRWAGAQNNLGNVLRELPSRRRG